MSMEVEDQYDGEAVLLRDDEPDSDLMEEIQHMDEGAGAAGGSGEGSFAPEEDSELRPKVHAEYRKIPVPAHRYTPLHNEWATICAPIVHNLKLEIRMNTRARRVELRNTPDTEEESALQRAADFIKAFLLGFEVEDAMALLRMDDLYIESFQVDDVKMLKGEHMSRAIGRIAGKDGRTRFAIENATRTRIVLADKHVHILGSYTNIKLARDAICALILGSPPGKVYARLRTVSNRVNDRY